MARKHAQFLVLAAFLTVASCSVYNTVQIIETDENVFMQQDIIDVQTTKDDFLYHVTNKRGIPCILANIAIKMTVSYKNENGTTSGSLEVPPDAKVNGTCSDAKSEMIFTWTVKEGDKSKDNNVTLTFINDYTDFSLYSITAHVYLNSEKFPGFTGNKERDLFVGNDLRLFAAPVKTGLHKCEKETIKKDDFQIDISNISVIAFNKVNDFSMRKEVKCSNSANKTKTFPYVLADKNNNACILARMSISITMPYPTKDSGTKTGTKSVPDGSKISGPCGTSETTMTITWSDPKKEQSAFAAENVENTVTIKFAKNCGSTYVTDIYFNIHADSDNFPGSSSTRLTDRALPGIQELIAPYNGLYSCAHKAISLEKSVMDVSNLLLVAFDAEKDFSTKTAVDCKSELSPKENDFNYIVRNSDGVACVLANMNIVIDVEYERTDNKNKTISIPVPSTLTSTGDCEYAASKMRLTWSKDTVTRSIVFYIRRNSSSNFFFVYQVQGEISLDKENFPDAISQGKVLRGLSGDSEYLFAANASNGMYDCAEEQHVIPMTEGMKMTITNVTFIAFNEDEDLATRQSQGCSKEPDTTTPTTTVATTPSTPPTEPPTEPTTVAPKPDPSVTRSAYYVMKSGTDIACIVANMTISLQISYDKANSGSNAKTLTVPKSGKVEGKCDNVTSTMELIWQEKTDATFDTTDTRNVVTLTFQRTGLKFTLHSVNVSWYMDEKNFPDAKHVKQRAVAFAENANVFTSTVGKLYKCDPKVTKKVDHVDVTISDMSLIAFNTDEKISAKAEDNCVTEESGSNTGAIVGGIIGGLILAGLLGYGVVWYLKRRRTT